MTDTVYPLYGSYEDWAYAAGWEPLISTNKLTVCRGVPEEQQGPIKDLARTLLFLVEADYDKEP
jgi:hypothetical protein